MTGPEITGPVGVDRRPHVAHIVGTPGAGGVQKLILTLARTPEGQAYRHSIICVFDAEGRFSDRFEEARIPIASCPLPWPDVFRVGSYRAARWLRQRLVFTFPRRLARLLQGGAVDLVHSHLSHRIDLQAEAALKRLRLPLVWTIHSLYHLDRRDLRRWRRAVELAARHPSAIATVAEEIARDFRSHGFDHPDGVQVIRGGVDAPTSRPVRDPDWRTRRGIPPGALVVGAAGRLVPQKGYDVFIRAARRAVANGIDAHFVIAGDGPLRDALRKDVALAGLDGRFQLLGFESDVPSFLAQLDVFVLSSRQEGFPIALLEALGAGLPVIATRVGGVPEMLGDDGGLVVAPESDEELGAAIGAMASAERRSGFAERGIAMARHFPLERTAREFVALYQRLLETRTSRAFPADRPTRIPIPKVKVT